MEGVRIQATLGALPSPRRDQVQLSVFAPSPPSSPRLPRSVSTPALARLPPVTADERVQTEMTTLPTGVEAQIDSFDPNYSSTSSTNQWNHPLSPVQQRRAWFEHAFKRPDPPSPLPIGQQQRSRMTTSSSSHHHYPTPASSSSLVESRHKWIEERPAPGQEPPWVQRRRQQVSQEISGAQVQEQRRKWQEEDLAARLASARHQELLQRHQKIMERARSLSPPASHIMGRSRALSPLMTTSSRRRPGSPPSHHHQDYSARRGRRATLWDDQEMRSREYPAGDDWRGQQDRAEDLRPFKVPSLCLTSQVHVPVFPPDEQKDEVNELVDPWSTREGAESPLGPDDDLIPLAEDEEEEPGPYRWDPDAPHPTQYVSIQVQPEAAHLETQTEEQGVEIHIRDDPTKEVSRPKVPDDVDDKDRSSADHVEKDESEPTQAVTMMDTPPEEGVEVPFVENEYLDPTEVEMDPPPQEPEVITALAPAGPPDPPIEAETHSQPVVPDEEMEENKAEPVEVREPETEESAAMTQRGPPTPSHLTNLPPLDHDHLTDQTKAQPEATAQEPLPLEELGSDNMGSGQVPCQQGDVQVADEAVSTIPDMLGPMPAPDWPGKPELAAGSWETLVNPPPDGPTTEPEESSPTRPDVVVTSDKEGTETVIDHHHEAFLLEENSPVVLEQTLTDETADGNVRIHVELVFSTSELRAEISNQEEESIHAIDAPNTEEPETMENSGEMAEKETADSKEETTFEDVLEHHQVVDKLQQQADGNGSVPGDLPSDHVGAPMLERLLDLLIDERKFDTANITFQDDGVAALPPLNDAMTPPEPDLVLVEPPSDATDRNDDPLDGKSTNLTPLLAEPLSKEGEVQQVKDDSQTNVGLVSSSQEGYWPSQNQEDFPSSSETVTPPIDVDSEGRFEIEEEVIMADRSVNETKATTLPEELVAESAPEETERLDPAISGADAAVEQADDSALNNSSQLAEAAQDGYKPETETQDGFDMANSFSYVATGRWDDVRTLPRKAVSPEWDLLPSLPKKATSSEWEESFILQASKSVEAKLHRARGMLGLSEAEFLHRHATTSYYLKQQEEILKTQTDRIEEPQDKPATNAENQFPKEEPVAVAVEAVLLDEVQEPSQVPPDSPRHKQKNWVDYVINQACLDDMDDVDVFESIISNSKRKTSQLTADDDVTTKPSREPHVETLVYGSHGDAFDPMMTMDPTETTGYPEDDQEDGDDENGYISPLLSEDQGVPQTDSWKGTDSTCTGPLMPPVDTQCLECVIL